ncbi:hypothetical protein SAMN02982997_00594 [Legionella micdadei]|uniref:Uncharacterized protein n=1 Tax=Legionella micdadei TaxID=451 RepID=A0A1G5CF61_LEGMI|nr:hypothetical protein Lmic_0937 [Legionella micdadei]SCY00944.1 hypothetical protein SAMN02982997_00594 [Legionella micdadei]
MSEENTPGFLCHSDALENPRIDRMKKSLKGILFVVICATYMGLRVGVTIG